MTVVPVDHQILQKAIYSKIKDFEDAVQHYSALAVEASVIVIRNQRNFRHAAIPVMNAREYLHSKG